MLRINVPCALAVVALVVLACSQHTVACDPSCSQWNCTGSCHDCPNCSFFLKGRPVAPLVSVEITAMSRCPDTIAFERFFQPVLSVHSIMRLSLLMVLHKEQDGSLSSKHGPEELAGDIWEVCAQAQGNTPAFFKFLLCMGEGLESHFPESASESAWRCAETSGLCAYSLTECAQGPHGHQLLVHSAARREEVCDESCWAPTVYINDKPVCRWPAPCPFTTNDFIRHICSEYHGEKPAACNV